MTNATQFAINLNKFADDELDEILLEVVQKFATTGLSKLVVRSPVDTGRFRGNWYTTIGQGTGATSDSTDKSGNGSIKSGEGAILGMSEPKTVFLQNNLPYGPRLEGGWSKQAPGGMVAITFAELEAMTV